MHVMVHTPPSQFRQQWLSPAPLSNVVYLSNGQNADITQGAWGLVAGAVLCGVVGFLFAQQSKRRRR